MNVDPATLDGKIVDVCEKLNELFKREKDIKANVRSDIDNDSSSYHSLHLPKESHSNLFYQATKRKRTANSNDTIIIRNVFKSTSIVVIVVNSLKIFSNSFDRPLELNPSRRF